MMGFGDVTMIGFCQPTPQVARYHRKSSHACRREDDRTVDSSLMDSSRLCAIIGNIT